MALLNACQVISQFSAISAGTGDGRTHAEPAATFVRILSLSNFELFTFGAGCAIPHATFYTQLAIKTTLLPLGPVMLLWIRAVLKRGSPAQRRAQAQNAAKFALLWLELVLPTGAFALRWPLKPHADPHAALPPHHYICKINHHVVFSAPHCNVPVATTIAQAFACEMIDGQKLLRVQLSQACDPLQARRRFWRNWAIISLLAYPVGVPLLLLCLLLPQRTRILELQDELQHQSSVAQRPVGLLDLSTAQRDARYEETRLVVKVRQGNEASRAFDRQRRMRALVFGTGMLPFGIAPYAVGAPVLYRTLGFCFGVLPGLTFTLLAVTPGDISAIARLMKCMVGLCCLLMLLYLYSSIAIINTLFSEGSRVCIDYQGVSVPCWVSISHALMYFTYAILMFEIGIRRNLTSLCAQRVHNRFDLIWGLWARWLFGYTFLRTVLLLLPYLFFAECRAFLGSGLGMMEVLSLFATSALSKFAFTPRYSKSLEN